MDDGSRGSQSGPIWDEGLIRIKARGKGVGLVDERRGHAQQAGAPTPERDKDDVSRLRGGAGLGKRGAPVPAAGATVALSFWASACRNQSLSLMVGGEASSTRER